MSRFLPVALCLWLLTTALPLFAAEPEALWRVRMGESEVYLLGSIHAMRQDMYPLPDVVMDAYRQADTVIFEVDLTRLTVAMMSRSLLEEGLYPPGQSLEQHIAPETLKMLEVYLREQNLAMDNVYRMRPWYLNLMVGQQELALHGYDPGLGIDNQLQQWALRDGKDIRELESFAEQVEILAADPPAVQETALRASIEDREKLARDLEQMVIAWRDGDAAEMLRIALDGTNDHPGLEAQIERVVFARNRVMVDRIRQMVAVPGRYLVVVGALHMGGERGIISLLRKDYPVSQVTGN